LLACANGVDTSFDPCSPLTIVPGADTGLQERESIQTAIDTWSAVLPTQIAVSAEPGDGPVLHLNFDDDSFYRAIYFDKVAEIWINRSKLEQDDFALAIAHELGHAFGLLHTTPEERISVMNVGNLTTSPTIEDARAVSALWEACLAN
jgi:Zn-dependent peptidase ImmA (M78 family)